MNHQIPVLAAEGISKRFGAQQALRDVSLEVRPGEIHGLLGQNGSGKSTLIKVLAGFHAPDSGTIHVDGQQLSLPVSGRDLRDHHLRFVHQDLALVPSLSVADNFNLDQLAAQSALAPARSVKDAGETERVLAEWGVSVHPDAAVETLSRLDRAKIAIVKAVRDFSATTRGGLLVLDEPTAFLPADEASALFETMRRVAGAGAGVLFVSHNLDEIMDNTDRATVLRDGQLVGTVDTQSSSVADIVQMILGRAADGAQQPAVAPSKEEAPIVTVSGLEADDLARFDLAIRPGEIVGLTGLIGSGFEAIPALLFGAANAVGGTLSLQGATLQLAQLSPRRAMRAGIGYVPSERLTDATAPTLTVGENTVVLTLDKLSSAFGRLTRRRLDSQAKKLLAPVDVRPNDPSLPLTALSGGNQQKVVLAKWLSISPRLLLISEPTQGVDIGAREQIAAMLREIAGSGCAVLCASSDLDQLTELCSRVLVFRSGAVISEAQGADVTKHNLLASLFSQDSGQRRSSVEREPVL